MFVVVYNYCIVVESHQRQKPKIITVRGRSRRESEARIECRNRVVPVI